MYWFIPCIFLLANPFKFNILRMVLESGLFAQIVLLILVFFSIFSWAIIIHKSRVFSRVDSHTRKFLQTFRRRKRLSEVYLACLSFDRTPLSKMLEVGYKELEEIFKGENVPANKGVNIDNERLEDIRTTMDRVGTEELENLGRRVTFLATTGNTSPFLGLLGTVWGVMDSFASIGVRGSASLAVVAPGIAQALIATIFGLIVAIPAVIGYNHFGNKLKATAVQVDNFSSEFISAVKKELHYEKKGLYSTL
jgi:biopolymer transport protein TolQ